MGVARQAFAEGDTHADGTLDVLRGGLDIASLAVGIASGGTNASARGRVRLTDTHLTTSGIVEVGGGTDASGELTAVNTDIAVGDDLRVGAFRGLIADDPPMLGRLQMRSGTLSVGGNALIGAQFTGRHGELLLDQVTATVGGLLRVGASSNLGTLFGTGEVELRQSSLDVTGTVLLESGSVRLVDSSATFANDLIMSSITSFGAEVTADATLALQRSQVTVAGLFTIGEGDTLRIAIEAATRGDGYGALDVGSAVLGGGLVLDFAGFTGVDPDYVFDLIVADSLGTITGDFTSLLVDGLSPSTRSWLASCRTIWAMGSSTSIACRLPGQYRHRRPGCCWHRVWDGGWRFGAVPGAPVRDCELRTIATLVQSGRHRGVQCPVVRCNGRLINVRC